MYFCACIFNFVMYVFGQLSAINDLLLLLLYIYYHIILHNYYTSTFLASCTCHPSTCTYTPTLHSTMGGDQHFCWHNPGKIPDSPRNNPDADTPMAIYTSVRAYFVAQILVINLLFFSVYYP